MNDDGTIELGRLNGDELRELYRKDPRKFDLLAGEALAEACIGRTPEKSAKLRQLQWNIDSQLHKEKTPLGRMLKMETIFYNRVYGEEGELSRLTDCCVDICTVLAVPEKPAPHRTGLVLVKK